MREAGVRPRKRLGRMRRARRLGRIVPLTGEKIARESEGKAGEPEGG